MQEFMFLFSKSPVLSSCVDSYTLTKPDPSHRVILNNAHFWTNAMYMGVDWHSCSYPSDLQSGLVRSGRVLTRACGYLHRLSDYSYQHS